MKTRVRAHTRRDGSRVREHQREVKARRRSDKRDELAKPIVHGVVAVTVIDAASSAMRGSD